jgi:hypothetical protein
MAAPEVRTFFPFTLLRLRHWRTAPDALEREQIDRVGGLRRPQFGLARARVLRAPSSRAPGEIACATR